MGLPRAIRSPPGRQHCDLGDSDVQTLAVAIAPRGHMRPLSALFSDLWQAGNVIHSPEACPAVNATCVSCRTEISARCDNADYLRYMGELFSHWLGLSCCDTVIAP